MTHRVEPVSSMSDWTAHMATTKQFGGKALVVDFSAVWCGPCKAIGPVFEQLSTQYPTVQFVKVDVDEMSELAGQAGVKAMPTFQAYFSGEKVDELVGADKNRLKHMIERVAARAGAGAGRTLGGGQASGSAGAADDTPEARRAKALAAIEARMKA